MFPEDENVTDAQTVIGGAQIRIRVSHKYTQRDGWRHETTVEISAPDNPEALTRLLTHYERLTDEIGRDENEARNMSDQLSKAVAA